MRKLLPLLLLAIALLLLLPSGALAADSQLQDNRGHSVDIVVLMDQSASMHRRGSSAGNDEDDNRIVAAQMITAMCDMNGSRVAFVPFAANLLSEGEFIDMSSLSGADTLRNQIARYGKNTAAGTDYGRALTYAYNLLSERDDAHKASNNPMIILLTDGTNSLAGDADFNAVYLWNNANKLYESVTTSSLRSLRNGSDMPESFKDLICYDGTPLTQRTSFTYDDAACDALVHDVEMRCVDSGIPIYTVPLYQTDGGSRSHVSRLQELSDKTGAKSLPVRADEAEDLPFFFADIFADQIGSSQRRLKINQIAEGVYEVDIPILNRSIQEANIYIPLRYVDVDSLCLYDSLGQERRPDSNEIYRTEVPDAFVLYKMCVKSPTGIWKLQFHTLSSDVTPEDISFSLLYNYNISLISSVNGSSSGCDLSKSGTLTLESYFFDNATQDKSTDDALYATQASEEDTIRFVYSLLDAYYLPVVGNISGEMAFDPARMSMVGQIDLSAYSLKSGDYFLQIVADGAGLHRESLVPVHLLNGDPAATGSVQDAIEVEFSDEPESNADQVRDYDLTQYVSDPDGDPLGFNNLQILSGDGILGLRLNGTQLQAATLRGNDGHYLSGSVSGTVTAFDNEGGSCVIGFDLTVNSGWLIANSCDYVTTVDGLSDGKAQKNTALTFSMSPLAKSTQTPQSVSGLTGKVELSDSATGQSVVEIDMAPSQDNMRLEAVYTTPGIASQLTATCTYYYGGNELASVPFDIRVINWAPSWVYATPEDSGLFPKEMSYNASIYGALVSEKSEHSVDMSLLFKDSDPGEVLAYSVESSSPEIEATVDPDGKTLHLKAVSGGKALFDIVATDADGERSSFSVSLPVVNLFQRCTLIVLAALACIVAIILILLAIHQHNKPRFPEGGVLRVTLGASMFRISTQQDFFFHSLRKPKDPISMDSVVMAEVASEAGINHESLGKVNFLPVKGSEELRVTIDKKASGLFVHGDDGAKMLSPGTPLTLRPGREVTLSASAEGNPDHIVHIHYDLTGERASTSAEDLGGFNFNQQPSAGGGDLPTGPSGFDSDDGFGSSPFGGGDLSGSGSDSFGGGDGGFGSGSFGGGDGGFGSDSFGGGDGGFGSGSFGSDSSDSSHSD